MSPELLSFLDGPDLYPPAFDAEFSWPEDAVRDAPPATFGLAIVPDPPAVPPAKISLRAHIEGVDAIAQTVESLDPDDLTPEDRDELSAMLIAAIAGTKRKTDDTARVLAMFEHLEAAAKGERDRLDARMKYFARQTQRLTDYILATLDASQLDRLDGETSTLRRQKNPARLVIAEGATIPEEFLVYPDPPAPHPDKDAIKRAIKAKREIFGCSLAATFRLVRS